MLLGGAGREEKEQGRLGISCTVDAAVVAFDIRISRIPRSPLCLIYSTITSCLFEELKWLVPSACKAPGKSLQAAHIFSLLAAMAILAWIPLTETLPLRTYSQVLQEERRAWFPADSLSTGNAGENLGQTIIASACYAI